MGKPANKPEDVWKYIDKRGEDECWPWMSSIQKGYGAFRIACRYYKAHRIAYFLIHGGIDLSAPESNYECGFVLHRCDNPRCCNPKHLFLGDINANMADKVMKGRQYRVSGGRHHLSILSDEDAARIREAHLFGAKPKDLASAYGVSIWSLYPLLRNETYQSWA